MNSRRLFEWIGLFSAISLGLIGFLFIDAIIQKKGNPVETFFRDNPGMEPFSIFIFPVILTIGIAWIYRKFRDSSKKD